jgi:peptidoglycan/xylan/chitin deacetylase (PgdA/CDA1 family)
MLGNRLVGSGGLFVAHIVESLVRRTSQRVGIALVFHRIGDEPGDPVHELVPAHGRDLIEQYLAFVVSRFRVVRGSELRSAALQRQRGERIPLAITFDDDLPTHVQQALPVLRSQGATATFFLSGASRPDPSASWWHFLQLAVDQGVDIDDLLPHTAISRAPADGGGASIHDLARAIEAMHPNERAALATELRDRLGAKPQDAIMPAEDLRELVSAGYEVGFHTLAHARLPSLDDDSLDAAMRQGRDELSAATGRPVRLIAYPHGVADPRVAASARTAGYELGFTTCPRALGPATNPWLIPRIAPGFRSVGHLALRIAWALVKRSQR